MSATRSLRVLLPTLGSAGDVHPFIALGRALKDRGHRVAVITNPYFRERIETEGLQFLPVGTTSAVQETLSDPDLWHPLRGFGVVARRVVIPAIAEVYRHIETQADSTTVLAASSIAFGARIAQERLGLPMASVHLQPAVIRSLIGPGMFGPLRISPGQPMWLKRSMFRLLDWAAIDRVLARPLNDFRASLRLPPVGRILDRWLHSPQCVLGFFPDWFARPQPDWPANVHLVGFPLWDGGAGTSSAPAPLAAEARGFLESGAPPVIVTPGSAASTMQDYFRESIGAVHRLGLRAMLVTNFPEQLPSTLPAGVAAFGYLPFSEVLPRAALIIHHGGIGTLAQAVGAGIPQFIVPSSHDQFDNAARAVGLGLARSVSRARYGASVAAGAIRDILNDAAMAQRARHYAARLDPHAALAQACSLIERLRV